MDNIEVRVLNAGVGKAGGNASSNSLKYSIGIPTAWAKSLQITKEDRALKLEFDGEKIVITKEKN